jgi:hypothetical protein
MFSSALTHGIGSGDAHYRRLLNEERQRYCEAYAIYDKLLSLLEMEGLIPLYNPEEYFFIDDYLKYMRIKPTQHLKKLFDKIGMVLPAPTYAGCEFGIRTDYGIYSERDMLAIGVALDISKRFDKDIKICEIGAGVGHLAYYLNLLGYKDYTIVDIPTTSITQMYFLETNLPGHNIKLMAPRDFDGKYDLVINVDSFVEMGEETAKDYLKKIKKKSKYLISINSEINDFTINDICDMVKVNRYPFYLRKGYMQEEYRGEAK